jgi:hypothetical protein
MFLSYREWGYFAVSWHAMTEPVNPFPESDADRREIWQQLIVADSEAFAAGNWKRIEDYFDWDNFEGLRAMNSTNPTDWQIVFPNLQTYRDNWLAASEDFRKKNFVGLTTLEALYVRCSLDQIAINENRAIAVKKFAGRVECQDGSNISGDRQTLYRLHRLNGRWKIVGFLGFIPL